MKKFCEWKIVYIGLKKKRYTAKKKQQTYTRTPILIHGFERQNGA